MNRNLQVAVATVAIAVGLPGDAGECSRLRHRRVRPALDGPWLGRAGAGRASGDYGSRLSALAAQHCQVSVPPVIMPS